MQEPILSFRDSYLSFAFSERSFRECFAEIGNLACSYKAQNKINSSVICNCTLQFVLLYSS